jgi:hypothetical protein
MEALNGSVILGTVLINTGPNKSQNPKPVEFLINGSEQISSLLKILFEEMPQF